MKKKYDLEPIAGLFGDSIEQLKDLIVKPEYICPWCDETLTEDEAEDTSDCGCPCCRRIIDWEETEYPRYPKHI